MKLPEVTNYLAWTNRAALMGTGTKFADLSLDPHSSNVLFAASIEAMTTLFRQTLHFFGSAHCETAGE